MNTNTLINQKKYIDLDSTYRNRKLWPLSTDFVVDINAATRNTPANALDPILLAFPYEVNLTSALSTPTQIPLSVNSTGIKNFYRNSYIEIGGVFRLITSYNEITQIVTVTPAFGGPFPALTQYTIRKEEPFEGPQLTSANAPTTQTIFLNAGASAIDNYYNNFYVFLPNGSENPPVFTPPASYEYARIISYNGVTKEAQLATPLRVSPQAGVTYEILEFSRDNVVPLRYSGNQVIGNPTPYKIYLTSMTVPNRYILNGYGGRLQDYPYLYVSLYSANATTSTNAIYSNNNYSLQALFKVPVTSLFLSADQQFYNFRFSDMEQTISFKENDSLHFNILLPNGQIIEFEPNNKDSFFQDYIGIFPIECDPLEQVSVLFEITKLSQSKIEAESNMLVQGTSNKLLDQYHYSTPTQYYFKK